MPDHVLGAPCLRADIVLAEDAARREQQRKARTGALVYISLPPDGDAGLFCGPTPCSTGWYDIGGTSLSAPEWAGLIAIAAQIHGAGGLQS